MELGVPLVKIQNDSESTQKEYDVNSIMKRQFLVIGIFDDVDKYNCSIKDTHENTEKVPYRDEEIRADDQVHGDAEVKRLQVVLIGLLLQA